MHAAMDACKKQAGCSLLLISMQYMAIICNAKQLIRTVSAFSYLLIWVMYNNYCSDLPTTPHTDTYV